VRKKNGIKKEESDLIFGRHPVLESLKGFLPVREISLQEGIDGGIIRRIKKLAAEKGIPVRQVPRAILEQKAPGEKHQGIVASLVPYQYLTSGELLQRARHGGGLPFLLMLDHLQDPYNFGSLLRTAALTGAGGAIIPRDRACGVTPAVFKGSAGALAHVPVARTVNLARDVDFFKKEGLWIMGADMDGDLPFFKADFRLPLVLVIGGEGKGLSRLLRDKCDFLLRIPMGQAVSSLNAAVAAGIIMYEIFRQRGPGG
jgi:23S rRNA (guanosine2251-2'-O)-methyltransferase